MMIDWKKEAWEQETKDNWFWKNCLENDSLFENGSYVGKEIKKIVDKYGYEFVSAKFYTCKSLEKLEKKDDTGE